MPLVVMTGFPSSGKTTWALKLAGFLKDEHGKEVHVVREEELLRGEKNDILDGKVSLRLTVCIIKLLSISIVEGLKVLIVVC